MNNKQLSCIWFSVLVNPSLTPNQRKTLRGKASGGQRYGNIVQNREMLRIISVDPFEVIAHFDEIKKGPITVMDCRYQDGVRFGWEMNNENPPVMVPKINLETGEPEPDFPINEAHHQLFMRSEGFDGEGNEIFPSENAGAQWAGWDKRI